MYIPLFSTNSSSLKCIILFCAAILHLNLMTLVCYIKMNYDVPTIVYGILIGLIKTVT